MKFNLTLPGDTSPTELDTDAPAPFISALSANVTAQTEAAVKPVRDELDTARAALAAEAVRLRTLRLGADGVDAEKLNARLGKLDAESLVDFLADERAECVRAGVLAGPKRATEDGTPADPKPSGDNLDPNGNPTKDKPEAMRLSAFDDEPMNQGVQYGGARRAAATVAALLVALLSVFTPTAEASVAPMPVAELALSAVDGPAVEIRSVELTTDAPRVVASSATDEEDPARSPFTGLALTALVGLGATIFDKLRAGWANCGQITVTTPAQGYTAMQVLAIEGQLGVCRQDYTEGETAVFLTEIPDPGILMPKAAEAIAAGAKVYWDADGNPQGGVAGSGALTATASGNTEFGFALDAVLAADEEVRVRKVSL